MVAYDACKIHLVEKAARQTLIPAPKYQRSCHRIGIGRTVSFEKGVFVMECLLGTIISAKSIPCIPSMM